MSRRRKKEEQSGGANEAYNTPPWCVDRLLDDVPLQGRRFLECAAGDGNIITAVSARMPNAEWTSCEIRDECAGRLAGKSKVFTGDFLAMSPTMIGEGRLADPLGLPFAYPFDVVITNPPYSKAAVFIEHARLFAPVVIMLLPVNFLASEKRQPVHRYRLPNFSWILPNRPKFIDGAADSREYSWFIWHPDAGPECRTRVLALTPLEVRRAQEGSNVRAAKKRVDDALRARQLTEGPAATL